MTARATYPLKVSRPLCTEALVRKRLFTILDRGRKRPVIWIAGPAGTGKTTLVSSYIEQRRLPCVWYQVDGGDQDLATFFYYLGIAGKKAAPGRKHPLPLLTSEYLFGVPDFSRNFFADLSGRLTPPAFLVFDDLQEVTEDAPLHGALAEGLARLPEGVTLVLVCRSEPAAIWLRLQANGALAALGWDELRFTQPEFEKILAGRSQRKIGSTKVRQIYTRLDGWAAGLRLAEEWVRDSEFTVGLDGPQAPTAVLEYFAEEVFSRLGAGTRNFLLKICLLPRMHEEMAVALSAEPTAGRILSYLAHHSLFTKKHAGAKLPYAFHALFREFLLRKAQELFDPGEILALQREAARLLQEAGQHEDAVRLLREAADWKGLTELILTQARALVAEGRSLTLENWIAMVPENILTGTPWLLYWLGISKFPLKLTESRTHLETAYRLFGDLGDPTGSYLSWAAIVETHRLQWSSMVPLDDSIAEMEKLRAHYPDFPAPEVEARVTANMFAALLFRQPDHPDMESWTKRMESLVDNCGDSYSAVSDGWLLLLYLHWMARLPEAAKVWQITHRFIDAEDTPHLVRLLALTGEIMHLTYVGLPAACPELLQKGLKIIDETGIHAVEKFLVSQGIYADLWMGNLESAGTLIARLAHTLPSSPTLESAHFNHFAALDASLKGDLSGAEALLRVGVKVAAEVGGPFPLAFNLAALGQVLTDRGRHKEATQCLAEARRLSKRVKSPFLEVECFLFEAQSALARGREKSGVALLREAFTLGNRNGHKVVSWFQRRLMAELCLRALAEGIEVEYVRSIIRAYRLSPESPPLECEAWPWPVKIRTLGRFAIEIEGQPLRFSGRAQQRPLDLLKVLIASPGREVAEEQLAEMLWPDADGDMAHQSFTVTLHRLRRLIGGNELFSLQGGVLSLDVRSCWVDAWAFEQVCARAEETGRAGRDDEVLAAAKTAQRLYRGDFLPQNLADDWSLSARERLKGKYQRLLRRAGGIIAGRRRWEDAAEIFERSLEVDDLAEENYRSLMRCYFSMGRTAESLALFERCRRRLLAAFGVEPAAETASLAREIKSR